MRVDIEPNRWRQATPVSVDWPRSPRPGVVRIFKFDILQRYGAFADCAQAAVADKHSRAKKFVTAR